MQDWDDDAMLREVTTAVREADDLAERVRAAGEAAYTWRGIDEEIELAGLAYDSLLDAGPAVRSGAGTDGRTVLFTGRSASVHVERDGAVAFGQLVPPAPGWLTVEGVRGYHAESEVDDLGCFSFTPPDDGPVRLRLRAGSMDVVTDWIRI
jgi:hypothetical protein